MLRSDMDAVEHTSDLAAEDIGLARDYGKDFWRTENLNFREPWYRLEKAVRLIDSLSKGRDCTLLDVGCGPATLMRMLPPNVRYYGIDIAIQDPASNLLEADVLETPIRFGDRRFDIVVAEGLFEYLGGVQSRKFSEIAQILNPGGIFLVTYTNFDHRRRVVSEPFTNVQSFDDFRESLTRHFTIERIIPEAHNWKHGQPNRRWLKALNMHLNRSIPVISRKLAVEYFFVCSLRREDSAPH
jgi:SAM-dependent methyltransferase